MKHYIVVLLALCNFLTINGQEVTKKDSVLGFNAMDYLMQDRYKYPDLTFMKKHWLDNWYLQIGGGLFMPNRSGETSMKLMQDMHIAIGKNLSVKHGFRLGYNVGKSRFKDTNLEMKRSLLHLDYLFNVSAYINGYNPNRFFELSTILGAGYQVTSTGGETHRAPEGHLGLELRFKAGPQSFLTLEPMIQITDGYLQDDWRHLGLGSGATVNYIQYLRPLTFEKTNSSRYTKMSPFFVELATGLQFQDLNFGAISTKGGSYAAYVGKWLSDGFGVRGGVNASFNRVRSAVVDGYSQYNDAGYLDGRFDLLANPLGFLGVNSPKSWGGFHLFGGIVYGYAQPYDGRTDYGYSGYNTGLQGWLRLQDNMQLFLEPRMTFISSEQENVHTQVKEEVHETLYNLNLGVRLNYSTWDERKARYLRNTLFQPEFFIQAAGGLAYTAMRQCTYGGNGDLDFSGRLSAGYRLNPYHALRANIDYTKLQYEDKYQQPISQDLKTLSLDYMFGLSNVMQEGYDKDRTLGVDLYAGPVWSIGNNLFGGHAGVFMKKKLNAHTSVFVSPEVTFLPTDAHSPILHHNVNPLFNVYAGVEYAFKGAKDFFKGIHPQDRNKRAGSDFPFFVEAGVGSSAIINGPLDWNNTLGTSFKYAIGHWINPAVAVRLSAESAWNPVDEQLHRHQVLGGLDVMFNPFGMSADYQYDKSLGLNVVAGGNLGAQKMGYHKYGTVYGFGAGVQLWTKVMDNARFFFEPRYTHLMANNAGGTNDKWGNLSAQLGMRIDYVVPGKRIPYPASLKDFEDKGLYFLLGAGLTTNDMKMGAVANENSINTNWSVGAGYQFNPLSAARFTLDSQHMDSDQKKEDRFIASLAYQLNLNTLLSGYNPEGRFSTDLYAGPSAFYNMSQKYWSWGGVLGMQFGYKMNHRMSLHVSPEFHTAFHDGESDKRVSYKMGLIYRLNNRGRNMEKLDWFVNASSGVQLLSNAPISTGNTLGMLHKIGVGTWMNSLVGVRFTGTASSNRWAEKKTTTSKYLQHYSLQTSVLFDPISLIPTYDRKDAAAGLYLFGGPEMGMTTMEKNHKWNNQYTTGFNVGMQGWLKVSEHQRLFIEPSYSSTTINDGVTANGSRTNAMLGLNVGLSMDIVKHDRNWEKDDEFKHFFVQIGAGNGSAVVNQNHLMKPTLRPSYELTAGYRIDDLSSVRFSVGHNPGKKNVTLRDNDLSAAYQLNLSNLFIGNNPNRRLELEAFAGISCMKIEDLALAIGGVAGVQANYHLNNNLYLFISPEARITHSKYKTLVGVAYKW